MRTFALTILVACLGGCSAVNSADLFGHDEAFVVKTLGTPENRSELTMPHPDYPWMGPTPVGLSPGESFISLKYVFYWRDEKWYIFLASSAAYERIYGTKPSTAAADCVFLVQKYPKNAVF